MSRTTCKILIADDEYWVRENLKNLLNWQELCIELIEPAIDGEDALSKIEAERPDILITDVNMPFINGAELIRQAKELQPHMQVIVVSGYSKFSYVREALLNGAVDYLLKPITKGALLDVLEKALNILGSNREQEQEQTELHEKLLLASSVLRDGELSDLIAEDVVDAGTNTKFLELELQFSSFALITIRLTDLLTALAKYSNDLPHLCFGIKSILEKRIQDGRAVIFHNNYIRNEFICITDLDKKDIDALCVELMETLQKSTDSAVNIAVSNHYYAFNHIRRAYHEAHSALLMRKLGDECGAVYAEYAQSIPVHRRISPEHEKRLLYAIQSGNRGLAQNVIFSQIGLYKCEEEGWLFIEVKQTAEKISGMIVHRVDADIPPRSFMALQNLTDLLGMALEAQNVPEVCSVLEQMLDETLCEPTSIGASETIKNTVLRVQKHIEEKYFDDLSLTSLSKQFWVDSNYLSRAFKQVTGDNLMLAIAKKRIEKSTEFIMQSDLSLTEISYLVGYEDYTYFSRVFRKIKGVSPREYKTVIMKGETNENLQGSGGDTCS